MKVGLDLLRRRALVAEVRIAVQRGEASPAALRAALVLERQGMAAALAEAVREQREDIR